jgi:hypothetical protein
MTIRCTNCSHELDREDVCNVGGSPYCQCCHSDLFYECENCGKTARKDEIRFLGNDKVCKECYDKGTFVCIRCGDIAETGKETENGKVCELCLEDL